MLVILNQLLQPIRWTYNQEDIVEDSDAKFKMHQWRDKIVRYLGCIT